MAAISVHPKEKIESSVQIEDSPEAQNSPQSLEYTPKRLSWSRKVMLGLKSFVKTIAKPRPEEGAEGIKDRKVAVSSLFVNINSVASDVIFPKEDKEAALKTVKEEREEEVVVEDPSGKSEGCPRDSPCPV